MKEVWFILETTYPYEERLRNHLINSNINLYSYPTKEHQALIITDCSYGIEVAKAKNICYLFYETETNNNLHYNDCQCIITGFDDLSYDFILKMYNRYNNIPCTIAETDRLIIKELTLDDIDDLYSLYNDSSIAKYCAPLHEDKNEEIEFQKSYIDTMYGLYGFGMWNLYKKSDNSLIGRAGLGYRDGFDELELGYMIKSTERNKGYAFEASSKILEISNDLFECGQINCFIEEGNTASIALCQKLGFSFKEKINADKTLLLFTYSYK